MNEHIFSKTFDPLKQEVGRCVEVCLREEGPDSAHTLNRLSNEASKAGTSCFVFTTGIRNINCLKMSIRAVFKWSVVIRSIIVGNALVW